MMTEADLRPARDGSSGVRSTLSFLLDPVKLRKAEVGQIAPCAVSLLFIPPHSHNWGFLGLFVFFQALAVKVDLAGGRRRRRAEQQLFTQRRAKRN